MDWFNKSLHAAFNGGANCDIASAIAAGQLEINLIQGATPDVSDTGHEFWSDLVAAGATINSTVQLNAGAGASWANRLLDGNDGLTITDPASGASTWAIVRINTGTPSTSRLLGADDIADLTHDGQDDTLNFDPNGILKLGS